MLYHIIIIIIIITIVIVITHIYIYIYIYICIHIFVIYVWPLLPQDLLVRRVDLTDEVGNPRPQLEPLITSLEKMLDSLNFIRDTSLLNFRAQGRGLFCLLFVASCCFVCVICCCIMTIIIIIITIIIIIIICIVIISRSSSGGRGLLSHRRGP